MIKPISRTALLKQRTIQRYKVEFKKGFCAWCKKPLSGRRRTWCSNECLEEFYLRVDWKTASANAIKKANNKCSLCKIDVWELYTAMCKVPKYKHKYNVHSFEVDHIVPVCEGGDNEPDNLRVLCVFCHKEETKKLRHRLKKV